MMHLASENPKLFRLKLIVFKNHCILHVHVYELCAVIIFKILHLSNIGHHARSMITINTYTIYINGMEHVFFQVYIWLQGRTPVAVRCRRHCRPAVETTHFAAKAGHTRPATLTP